MQQSAISALAVAIAVIATPLFLDLAVCIAGNLRRARGPHAAVRRPIRMAVVAPAHDEETMIARTVASLQAADPATPVFVVAHNCTDATAAVARQAGARVVELKNPALRGKGAALRHGFAAALAAGANAILVIDADSVVSTNLLAVTRAMLEEGAEATQCRYELELPASGSAAPLARLRALAFRGMNVLRGRGRAGLGFSTGIFGNGFALTAAVLERVPFNADSIAEDVEYHTRLARAGVRVYWIGDAFVHAQLAASGAAQASQESRWEGGRFKVASRATGRLLAAVLRGRWRALETLADVWSLALSRGILVLLLAAALPVHWLRVYAMACGGIALLYVLQAAWLGAEPMRDLAALAAAPLYLVWKAAITPIVLRHARSRAEWARTKREAPQP
ncbi:MAG: glycosyltransferase family 2 protein [Terracidiphilus sp.]|jgi:cellulose synthase/poly-beta-1,6-N-acetylglucosamine synthase-like glycosyltransferase